MKGFLKQWIMLFVVLLSMVFIAPANSQELIIANQVSLIWDASPGFVNGEAFLPTDQISYRIYLGAKDNPILLGETSDTSFIVSFTSETEGWYYAGLETIRKLADGTEVSKSDLLWTDNPVLVFNGETFMIGYYRAPANASGLRVVAP